MHICTINLRIWHEKSTNPGTRGPRPRYFFPRPRRPCPRPRTSEKYRGIPPVPGGDPVPAQPYKLAKLKTPEKNTERTPELQNRIQNSRIEARPQTQNLEFRTSLLSYYEVIWL